MNELINPTSIAAPAAAYSHAVLTPAGSRLLHTSGVVATRPDATIAADVAGQAESVWATIAAILAAADMTLKDVVSYTTYVVVGQPMTDVMAVRDRILGGHRAASTLIPVPALARPEWLIEIAVVAAAK